LPV
ncbi:restriction endonuclease family protein, partial [Vibrio parahaemolyticus EKP-021]|jgi:hypothetical protein